MARLIAPQPPLAVPAPDPRAALGAGTTRMPADGDQLRAADVAGRMSRWGFLAHPDLPDTPGPAFLLVALRPSPTMQHYDPEAVDYWATHGGRGERRTLTRETPMPRSEDFSWGLIRIVDRLHVTNEYLTFGGHLDAATIDDIVVAAFASPAPLLRRGGHSQGWDAGADVVGAFFGRLMVAVDYTPGFENLLGSASPLARYAAFVIDATARKPATTAAGADEELQRLLHTESVRLRASARPDWEAASELLVAATTE
jgi:hypothetical protein